MSANGLPLISVVMPVYNGAEHLDEAVASVLRQTLEDLELVVVDDGSSDDSARIARLRAEGDSRVRLIRRENRGASTSRNEGVAAARGEWVAFMDSDDICVPARLRRQLDWLMRTGADVCGADIRVFGGGRRAKPLRHYTEDRAIRTQLLFDSAFAQSTVIARRSLLMAHPYDASLRAAEDYELWTRLARAGSRMTNCPEVLVRYRRHTGQLSAVARDELDRNRLRIASDYRKTLTLPEIPDAVFRDMLDVRGLLTPERIIAAVDGFRALLERGDGLSPEVVAENAFLFLGRHSDIGLARMRGATKGLLLSRARRALLLGLSASRLSPRGRLYGLLKRAW